MNDVDCLWHLAQRDDRCGEAVECDEAAAEFFAALQQLAKAVEPA